MGQRNHTSGASCCACAHVEWLSSCWRRSAGRPVTSSSTMRPTPKMSPARPSCKMMLIDICRLVDEDTRLGLGLRQCQQNCQMHRLWTTSMAGPGVRGIMYTWQKWHAAWIHGWRAKLHVAGMPIVLRSLMFWPAAAHLDESKCHQGELTISPRDGGWEQKEAPLATSVSNGPALPGCMRSGRIVHCRLPGARRCCARCRHLPALTTRSSAVCRPVLAPAASEDTEDQGLSE